MGSPHQPPAPSEVRLLHALFDKLPAMIAYWDAEARNVIANEAYVEWFGYHPEEMKGLHISEVHGAEVYAKNRPYIEGALGGAEQLFERTLVDQSGRTRHTQASYVPDVVDGTVRGFFVLVTDVTPRVEAQRALDEAQDIAQLGSWTLDPRTDEVTWSRGLFTIVGLDPDQGVLEREGLLEYVHPEDRDHVLSVLEHAVETGEPYESEYSIVRADGVVREVISRGRPVVGPDGTVVRVSGTLQDITEANAVARALGRMNEELRHANQLNADVLATLGHDIRTPLAVIRGYLEILDEDPDEEPAQRRSLISRTRAAANTLQSMVEGILEMATLDSGKIVPRSETIDLGTALTEMVAAAVPDDVRVEVVLGVEDPVVVFDRVHLEQIVANLLANAVRYGRAPIGVEVRADSAGRVELAVRDAGSGVPPGLVDQLFTRFARTGDRQRAAGGTGFGLYMSARLAEANGARLSYVAPTPGSPHEFCLRFPLPDGPHAATIPA
jgi:PAS domain S-box-containing protein